MATDAQILAAARELSRAIDNHRKAMDARKIADNATTRAIAHEEECRKRVVEARTWLIQAGEKAGPEPTPKVEPAPKPPVELPPMKEKGVEAPKLVTTGHYVDKPKRPPNLSRP